MLAQHSSFQKLQGVANPETLCKLSWQVPGFVKSSSARLISDVHLSTEAGMADFKNAYGLLSALEPCHLYLMLTYSVNCFPSDAWHQRVK